MRHGQKDYKLLAATIQSFIWLRVQNCTCTILISLDLSFATNTFNCMINTYKKIVKPLLATNIIRVKTWSTCWTKQIRIGI